MKKYFLLLIFIIDLLYTNEQTFINRVINKTNAQYNLVNDYEVDMLISMSVPAFRMPKKKYKVYFMQPDLIKIKSKGFGMLPKTGMFTSPLDNFDNLSNMSIKYIEDIKNQNDLIISGSIIIDSLKIEIHNEYSKLTFKPKVEVLIDTSQWVIKSVITKIDTLKLFEIYNKYDFVENDYFMPVETEIKYFLKNKNFSNWLKKDINKVIKDEGPKEEEKLVEGNILVKYKN